MTESEKLYEAAKLIQNNCKAHAQSGTCRGCYFDKSNLYCPLAETPAAWGIKKPCRWTNEDIALAKALKAFGGESVYKHFNTVVWCTDVDGIRDSGNLPFGSFKNLKISERASIDDIIKEGENNDQ